MLGFWFEHFIQLCVCIVCVCLFTERGRRGLKRQKEIQEAMEAVPRDVVPEIEFVNVPSFETDTTSNDETSKSTT